MPIQDSIMMPQAEPLTVALAPAQNALHSLFSLIKAEHLSGLGDWVYRTAERLTAQERQRHRLVMIGLHYAVMPEQIWPSFPAYLEHLARCNPMTLHDRMLTSYASIAPLAAEKVLPCADIYPVDYNAVLKDTESYLDFLKERFPVKVIDEELEVQAYRYVIDPPAMRTLIVEHLRHMWDKYLADEWQLVLPMLEDAVSAFQQTNFSAMERFEAARFITGQELEAQHRQDIFACARRVVFVPSAHIGPYLRHVTTNDETYWVIFGARLPEGSQFHAPDLSRTEIVVRLNALADDTRLRILKCIAERGEAASQEVMAALELSQSAASRHLKQLSATGYLTERRCNGAKCYRLNPKRVEDTLRAIAAFLLGSTGE